MSDLQANNATQTYPINHTNGRRRKRMKKEILAIIECEDGKIGALYCEGGNILAEIWDAEGDYDDTETVRENTVAPLEDIIDMYEGGFWGLEII